MAYKKVTAIVQSEKLESVEQALEGIGVPGISVTHVKGYGDYANFYHSPPLVSHARIEVYIDSNQVESVVENILDSAHTGTDGDGVIAVLPVDNFYRIRDKKEIKTGSTG